jgi:hypothetical protein
MIDSFVLLLPVVLLPILLFFVGGGCISKNTKA